ncbi:hypothetical protein [Acidiphilium acidophilum]|uniref:hypothetical protein n=1 Tax=Acidiphilium acidophilum TaxID=76588 RepID=UPI002E8E68D4|nr:hypothetical protein [Acidiphilium acidophilum]
MWSRRPPPATPSDVTAEIVAAWFRSEIQRGPCPSPDQCEATAAAIRRASRPFMADALKLRAYRDYLENRSVVRRAIDQIADPNDPKFMRAIRRVIAKADRQIATLQRGHDGLPSAAKVLTAIASDLRSGTADPDLLDRVRGAAALLGAGFDQRHTDAAWHRRAIDFHRLAIAALEQAGSKNLGTAPDSPAIKIVARALQLTENNSEITVTSLSKALLKGIKPAL